MNRFFVLILGLSLGCSSVSTEEVSSAVTVADARTVRDTLESSTPCVITKLNLAGSAPSITCTYLVQTFPLTATWTGTSAWTASQTTTVQNQFNLFKNAADSGGASASQTVLNIQSERNSIEVGAAALVTNINVNGSYPTVSVTYNDATYYPFAATWTGTSAWVFGSTYQTVITKLSALKVRG